MPSIETPQAQQQDQVTSAGAPVRAIQGIVMVNGVPTAVVMQVVAVTDPSGALIDQFLPITYDLAMLTELRAMRQLLCQIAQVPVVDDFVAPPA